MKKISLIVLILLTAFVLSGCNDIIFSDENELEGDKPPNAYIEIGNEKYDNKLGTYCWKTGCVDTAGPVELLKDKEPIQVQPEENVTFKMEFTPKPNEVHVSQINNGEETEVKIKNNHFTAPAEKGIYFYVYGVWWMDEKEENLSYGDAFYAFVLEVK